MVLHSAQRARCHGVGSASSMPRVDACRTSRAACTSIQLTSLRLFAAARARVFFFSQSCDLRVALGKVSMQRIVRHFEIGARRSAFAVGMLQHVSEKKSALCMEFAVCHHRIDVPVLESTVMYGYRPTCDHHSSEKKSHTCR